MEAKEIRYEGGFKAIITKNKNGKYIYVLTRRNKSWQSNGQYSRPFTAKRGAERAIHRITSGNKKIESSSEFRAIPAAGR